MTTSNWVLLLLLTLASMLAVYCQGKADSWQRRWADVVALLNDETARHIARLADVRREHAAAVAENHAQHRAEITRLTTILQTGRPEIPDAIPLSVPPDAEARLLHIASEATIQVGMERLKEEYAQRGMHFEDEVVRAHVLALLNGESPSL